MISFIYLNVCLSFACLAYLFLSIHLFILMIPSILYFKYNFYYLLLKKNNYNLKKSEKKNLLKNISIE